MLQVPVVYQELQFEPCFGVLLHQYQHKYFQEKPDCVSGIFILFLSQLQNAFFPQTVKDKNCFGEQS